MAGVDTVTNAWAFAMRAATTSPNYPCPIPTFAR
jgi:hypothetical protein